MMTTGPLNATTAPGRTPAPVDGATPAWLVAELRSDHAGETGAVQIYRGILAVTGDPALRDFAGRHLLTEEGHLELIAAILPPARRSLLLPIWKVAGFVTGALPALFGPRAVHVTIDAVESFVDHHYQQQIDRLRAEGGDPALLALLLTCQEDEVEHRDEARSLHAGRVGPVARAWGWIVGAGSKAAVAAAKRV